MKITHLARIAALTATFAASASAQGISTPSGPVVQVGAISDFNTFFNELGGMTVSWVTTTGTGSGVWANLGGGNWGVVGTGFSLSANGNTDTFGSFGGLDPFVWNLTATNLVSFSLNPVTAGAVFDITNPPDVGTPGSSYGHPVDFGTCFIVCFETADQWHTTATYTGEVGVGGNAPDGDLWSGLTVTFGDVFGKTTKLGRITIGGDQSVQFSQDLDQFDGGFSTTQSVTPEPATMAMMATGLVGMAGAGFRRRRKR